MARRHRITSGFADPTSSRFGLTDPYERRQADLFWADLTGTSPVARRQRVIEAEFTEAEFVEAVLPVTGTATGVCTGPATVVDAFPVSGSTLDARQRGLLGPVVTEIVASQVSPTPVGTVCIVGHTDDTGTDASNVTLGQKRAAAVEAELRTAIDKKIAGLSAKLVFKTTSVGEASPLASNGTAAGRARNRSVEVTLGRQPARVCHKPIVSADDPTALNLFKVGKRDWDAGNVTVVGRTVPLKGTVFYPAATAGTGTPFASAVTLAPLVVMAHGNHGLFHDPADRTTEICANPGGFVPIPNHKGYDYLQEFLARMGILAISVDCGPTNCLGLSATNIRERAEMIIQSLLHFDGLNKTDAVFKGRLDLGRVGLLGHSRGAEAVLVAAETLAAPGAAVKASVKGVISVAPTDKKVFKGPGNFAFMAVLPAADGDVIDNDGAKFYDRALPKPFKCQLYIHGASHNLFNRQWVNNDGLGPALLNRIEHERILSVYGCAFYRTVLLGHPLLKFLRVDERPPATRSDVVHISFEQPGVTTVDDHENRNIALNTLGQPTTQSAGLTADEFDFSRTGAKTFNTTFFGSTVGLVSTTTAVAGRYRTALGAPRDLTGKEIWVRAAEVYNGTSVPPNTTGYRLGLEDSAGVVAFVDSKDDGGLPRPYDRRTFDAAAGNADRTKTMLKTQRFPVSCFDGPATFDMTKVRAVVLQLDRGDNRAIALDQLQIV